MTPAVETIQAFARENAQGRLWRGGGKGRPSKFVRVGPWAWALEHGPKKLTDFDNHSSDAVSIIWFVNYGLSNFICFLVAWTTDIGSILGHIAFCCNLTKGWAEQMARLQQSARAKPTDTCGDVGYASAFRGDVMAYVT
jgi:hypothetical protein